MVRSSRCSGSGSSWTGSRSSPARGARAASLLVVLEVVYSITDPPIKALRRVIPPLRIGSVALDLSFLIVMVGAYILLQRQPDGLPVVTV